MIYLIESNDFYCLFKNSCYDFFCTGILSILLKRKKKEKIAFSHVWSNVFNLNEVFSLHCLRFPGFTLFQL